MAPKIKMEILDWSDRILPGLALNCLTGLLSLPLFLPLALPTHWQLGPWKAHVHALSTKALNMLFFLPRKLSCSLVYLMPVPPWGHRRTVDWPGTHSLASHTGLLGTAQLYLSFLQSCYQSSQQETTYVIACLLITSSQRSLLEGEAVLHFCSRALHQNSHVWHALEAP